MAEQSSAAIRVMEIVVREMEHTAWAGHNGGINASRRDALELCVTARLPFALGDVATLYGWHGGHWFPEIEALYALAIRCENQSAVLSIEAWRNRAPFLLDGERVYVGKEIAWDGMRWRCTAIEADFVRVKRHEYDQTAGPGGDGKDEAGKWIMFPATLREIPRAGFEERIMAQKAAAKAEREKAREAMRADPIDLLPFNRHIAEECEAMRADPIDLLPFNRHIAEECEAAAIRCGSGDNRYRRDMIQWAESFGTDYRAAWLACTSAYWMGGWLQWIGLGNCEARTPEAIRKARSWPKIEAQLFRFVREVRGLPLRDPPKASG